MKAVATIDNLNSINSKYRIVRNLSRILDLRILNIDLENRTIHFVYDSILAFEKAKRELLSIGHPISKCRYQDPNNGHRRKDAQTQANLETPILCYQAKK